MSNVDRVTGDDRVRAERCQRSAVSHRERELLIDFPGLDEVLDDVDRDELLSSLLRHHPGAAVSARDDLGRLIEFPPSVVLFGQHIIRDGLPLQLIHADSRAAVIESWGRARVTGASTVRVALVNRAGASCHVIDVRRRHGAVVGMIVADAPGELLSALANQALVMPRIGRTEKDELATIVAADPHICRILGCELADLVGVRALDLIHPDDHARAVESWMEMLSTPDGTTRLRARHRRGDGTWMWMELTHVNRLETAGRVMAEMIDISIEMEALEALHRSEQLLRQSEQLLRRLAEALPSGVLHIDRDRHVVTTNARLRAVIGIDQADTITDLLSTVLPDDRADLDVALDRVLDGFDVDLEVRLLVPATATVHLCAIAMRSLTDADGLPDGAVLCVDDVTEAAELRAQLERRATVDHLTGCLNRATVLAELDRVLRRHAAGSPGTAVVFLDLDGFKDVNDTHGHTSGDQVLSSVVARLSRGLRAGDSIGRLGGDEFIVVLPNIDGLDEASQVGRRIEHELSEPLEVVAGEPMRIRASIGVAWSPDDNISALALTSAADHAMYTSKRAGNSETVCVLA